MLSRRAGTAVSCPAAVALSRLAIAVPALPAALMLASCGATPGPPDLFQHSTIEDVTAEHPNTRGVDLDGDN